VEPAKAFGSALRQRRKAAFLTQEKLGFEADLGRVFISWLETGKRQPTFETILKLAAALKCKAADIVADAEAVIADSQPSQRRRPLNQSVSKP
jgi:transcriptional regulator with XRE-family HTH domain